MKAKALAEEDGDLLMENPNHVGTAWRPHHSDEEESDEDESEEENGEEEAVDSLAEKLEQSTV